MTMNVPIVPRDTKAALQPLPISECSRSLYFDRFARPDLAKDERKEFFTAGFDAHRSSIRLDNWQVALRLKPADIVFAQLQSRLLINMAGGVMENAGLCLDRFGMPYLPGSAVKGCVRRMAIQELLEAREAGKLTGELAHLLATIALVFGWGEQDWNSRKQKGRFNSDFAYAVGADLWEEVSAAARGLLPKTDHFAGSVSFLPAYPMDIGKAGPVEGLPVKLPALGKLELDVVTCHHGKYYSGKQSVATDTEEPVPVFFPAVAAGHIFTFATRPLRSCNSALLKQARTWLADGLAAFGLGAKTAAGYGWFDASPRFNDLIISKLQANEQKEANRLKQELEAKLAVEKSAAVKADRDRKRASLTCDAAWIARFKLTPEGQRRETINKFAYDDEKWWPNQGELAEEGIQFSLLHFLLNDEPEFLAAERANPKSKTAKALVALKRKFPAMTPGSCSPA